MSQYSIKTTVIPSTGTDDYSPVHKSVTLKTEDDPFYSTANQAHLMKSIHQLQAGKGTVHELIEVDDE